MDLELLATKLDSVCRVCLKICDRDSNSRSVFGELKEQEILDDNFFFVYEILCSVTSILVNKGDGYPTLLCANCMAEANIAYKFKKQYEQSNEILSQCVEQKLNISEIFIKVDDQDVEEDDDEIKHSINENIEDGDGDNVSETTQLESCITSHIFNLSEIAAENVNIEMIFENLEPDSESVEAEEKPKIKNVSMTDENKIARKCPECKYVFQTAYAFHNHACNRDDLERKLCPTCGKSISKSHYNKHLYMHSGRRDYVCYICNKAYNASGSLKFHMAKHTGEKPYLCSLCGKRFIQPTALKYHMRFHNNERRYKCSYCEKTFVMQCHLVVHERTHTGLKPFTCQQCHKSFARKVELKVHAYCHSGEKPHKCSYCGKAFARKSHVTLHEMTHNGKRPYECPVCDKGFKQKRALGVHLQVHIREGQSITNEDDQEYQDVNGYDDGLQEYL